MKSTTRKALAVVALIALATTSLSAKVVFSGKGGVGRFFEMAFGAVTEKRGFVVDGVKAGLNALVDLEDGNMFTLEANARKAAGSDASVMTFSASFYRDAELNETVSLFMETGLESHVILIDSVATELGLACKGGIMINATDTFDVQLSAGLTDMLYSSAVSSSYGNASGSVSMIGLNAQIECTYRI